jgi:hypothetical protein
MSTLTSTFETLDDLTYDVEDDGVLARRQLDRVILSRGAWATVMFLYEELDRETGAYRAPKIAVVRFQKWRGVYRKHASLTLADGAEAQAFVATLGAWAPLLAGAADAEDGDSAAHA